MTCSFQRKSHILNLCKDEFVQSTRPAALTESFGASTGRTGLLGGGAGTRQRPAAASAVVRLGGEGEAWWGSGGVRDGDGVGCDEREHWDPAQAAA